MQDAGVEHLQLVAHLFLALRHLLVHDNVAVDIQAIRPALQRRFGGPSRAAAIVLILLYLVGYVGLNLFTIGPAMNSVLGWPVMTGALVTAFLVMLYMIAGGQTSVIMTDLAQGVILLIAGLGVFAAGVYVFVKRSRHP